MITADLVRVHKPGLPYTYAPFTREAGEQFLQNRAHQPEWELINVVSCDCCGEVARTWRGNIGGDFFHGRCERHQDRNPCAIEGCCRTRAANGRYGNDQWFCSEHWRRYVPPHSPLRRAYHRFWRLAKKQASPANPTGWTYGLSRRFERFWNALVARARRQSLEGKLDVSEINKLFGWDDAA